MHIKPKFGLTWGGAFFLSSPLEGGLIEMVAGGGVFEREGLFNLSVLHKELQYAEYKLQKLKYKKVGGHAA